MKRFWSSAASFFSLADEARALARQALGVERSRVGFAYAPCANAIPSWEKNQPKEVSI